MNDPLIVQAQESTSWYTGISLAENAADLRQSIQNDSWVDGTFGGVGSSLDMLSLSVDPIGTLASWGVAWLMEHVRPLKEALDWLAGNADEVSAHSETWKNVSRHTFAAAQEYQTRLHADIAHWNGSSAAVYRERADTHLNLLRSLSDAADGISGAVSGAGLLVGLVRGIVRDLIADFIGTLAARLPQWLAEAGLTLGAATPVVVAQVASLVAKWADRIQGFVRALLRSLRNLQELLNKLESLINGVIDSLAKMGRGAPEGTGNPTSSNLNRGWHEGDPIPPPSTNDGAIPADGRMLDKYHNESDPNEPWPFRPFRTPVHYMSPEEREACRLFVDSDGLLRQAGDGSIFDTTRARTLFSGGGRAIFVMDGRGNLYATMEQRLGHIHHSSFLGGENVAGAGEIEVVQGRVTAMTDQSGHYQPTPEMNDRVVRLLTEQGMAPAHDFKKYSWNGEER